MNEKPIIKRSAADRRKSQTDWQQVDALSETEIEEAAHSDPDAQPTEAEFWKTATLRMPESKQLITLRVDREVIDWYKRQGKGYQTRMNAVLRAYMEAHR
ncbi:MAG: BrnA antitoxin family protein [Candidatus Tectomicrobia bacterium]|nr:BrnA antitoxin family protein [Candidatus Tectomicrobia bacterium]